MGKYNKESHSQPSWSHFLKKKREQEASTESPDTVAAGAAEKMIKLDIRGMSCSGCEERIERPWRSRAVFSTLPYVMEIPRQRSLITVGKQMDPR